MQDENTEGTGHGDESLSGADITITEKIVEAGKFSDIAVLDHLIIATGYSGFNDNGIVQSAGAAYLFSTSY